MIDIAISKDAQALIGRISDTRGLLGAMAKTVDLQINLTNDHIREHRLSGRGPFPVSEHKLGERTHHLRNSLRPTKAVIVGDSVTASIGSNIKYAGIHEYGGTIKRVLLAGSVRLATDRQGNLLRQGRNGKLAVFARKSRKSVQTVSFPGGKRYDITIPARAPVRNGIEDRKQAMGDAVSKSIIAFWNKTGGAA